MLTTSELLELQDATQGKNPTQIIPILISPKTSKLDFPGIEVTPIKVSDSTESKNAKISKGLSFKHPDDNGIWFKIRNATNISHLIKIFDNRTVWEQQCTFPCHTVAACYCKNVIIVSLIDNTLNFIDSRTGCPCLPSILMQDYTKYLQRVDEDKIALITNKNQLIIYEIDANTIPKCLLKVYFYGDLDDIRYIELTKELKTKKLSPIIQTETNRYRYSIQRQCWTLPEYEFKSPFVKPKDNFESLDNVIKNFGYSLLTHDQALMEKTYLTMLNETPYECAIRLIEYSNAGIKEISGIELKDVLTHAFEYIQNNYSNIVDRIAESKQYALYLSEIRRLEEFEQNKQKDNSNSTETNTENNNSNEQTIENSNLNTSDNNINISGVYPPNSPSSHIQNSNNSINVTTSDILKSIKSNKSITKQQPITREVPTVESEEIEKRNSFNKDLYSPIQKTPDLFYKFDTTYENYVEHSQKKDPKVEKFIEDFTYSSKEQKEIAKKLKLRLPKRRSKSTDNEKKNDEDQKKQKKTKKRFIKPEIIQKKSSQQSRTAQQQPLLLTSFIPNSIKPMQSMQQIQQVQQIPQNRNSLNLQVQNHQQQTQQAQQKNANHINWLMNELKNPKQLEIFSNAITNSQWDQIMRIKQTQQLSQNQNPLDPVLQQILTKFKCSPAQARAQQKKTQQQNSTQMQQSQPSPQTQQQQLQQQNQNLQQQSQPLPQTQQQQLQQQNQNLQQPLPQAQQNSQQQSQNIQQIQIQQQMQSPNQQTRTQQSPHKIQIQQQMQSPQHQTLLQQPQQQIQIQQQIQSPQHQTLSQQQQIQMQQQTKSPQHITLLQQPQQQIQIQQQMQSPQHQTLSQQQQQIQIQQQMQSPQRQTRTQQSPHKNQMQQMQSPQQQIQIQQQMQSPQHHTLIQQPQQQIQMQQQAQSPQLQARIQHQMKSSQQPIYMQQPQTQIQEQVQTIQPQSQPQLNDKPKRKRQTKKKNESSDNSQNNNLNIQINPSQPIPPNSLNQIQNLTPK